VAGFLIHYLHHIETLDSEQSSDSVKLDDPILIVLGGYSYGSLITTHLPEPSEIIKTFAAPVEGTAVAEVKCRAENLAGQMNEQIRVLGAARIHHGNSVHKRGHTLSVGGEETSPEKRRRSTEIRCSTDTRRSLDIPRTLSQFRKKSHEIKRPSTPPMPTVIEADLPKIEHAYLLISPLLPPISTLTALSLKHSQQEDCERFSRVHSLAVFGNDDIFTSVKKLRKWTQEISSRPDSKFRSVEIEGAGHFWHDHQTQKQLRIAVKEWVGEISEACADVSGGLQG
jgi:alpha/beta superfamily hydrolase